MTKNVRHGLGLLVIAVLAGLAFLVLDAAAPADAANSQVSDIAGYAALAGIFCAVAGLIYLAIGLLKD